MSTQHFKGNHLLNLYREGKTYRWFVSSFCLREIKISLAASFLCLLPGLPACYPLFPPFSFRRIMLPRENGRNYHSITASELTRGVVPKLVRHHILLILIVRMFNPGAPNSSWKKLQ